MKKQQIIDVLIKYQDKVHSAGLCGELGDSFQALDADLFSDVADEIMELFKENTSVRINIRDMIQFDPYGRYMVKDIRTGNNLTVITYVSYDNLFKEHTMIVTKTLVSEEELKTTEE